jgi:hypothetical protein
MIVPGLNSPSLKSEQIISRPFAVAMAYVGAIAGLIWASSFLFTRQMNQTVIDPQDFTVTIKSNHPLLLQANKKILTLNWRKIRNETFHVKVNSSSAWQLFASQPSKRREIGIGANTGDLKRLNETPKLIASGSAAEHHVELTIDLLSPTAKKNIAIQLDLVGVL